MSTFIYLPIYLYCTCEILEMPHTHIMYFFFFSIDYSVIQSFGKFHTEIYNGNYIELRIDITRGIYIKQRPLLLICVCHTASATPQRPDMTKNTTKSSGFGVQYVRVMFSPRLMRKPRLKTGTRPYFRTMGLNPTEQMASQTP